MLRGGVIVVTALCSHFILKKPLQKYQIIGCGFAILGITLVGISNFPPFSSPSK
jgi:drug/metabolite transporter (DMT)-like permease